MSFFDSDAIVLFIGPFIFYASLKLLLVITDWLTTG